MGFLDWVRQVFIGGGTKAPAEAGEPAPAAPEPAPDAHVQAGPLRVPRSAEPPDVSLGFETPPTRPKKATVVARGERLQPKRNKKANKGKNGKAPGFGGPPSVLETRPERPRPAAPVSVPPIAPFPVVPPPASPAPVALRAVSPKAVGSSVGLPIVSPDAPTEPRSSEIGERETDVRTPNVAQVAEAPHEVLAERPTEIRDEAPPATAAPERPERPERPDRAERGPRAASDGRASRRGREQETLSWVVVPKLDALLRQVDDVLANGSADRSTLVTARNRFEREWRALSPVPPAHAERLTAAYRERVATIEERIRALPDPRLEDEARALAARAAMVVEAEGLATVELQSALGRARTLQRQWREAGRVSKEALAEFGPRFKVAIDAVFARREDERSDRTLKLRALVEQAEVLGRSRDPAKAAEAMKQLQVRWKAVGGVRGEEGDALWSRFRAAADQVFAQRRSAQVQAEEASVAAREALIAQANTLADEGVDDPDEVIRQLQGKWRRLAPPPRDRADSLWTQFRAALDRLRSPPPVEATALGDGRALRFNPFATLVPATEPTDTDAGDEVGS